MVACRYGISLPVFTRQLKKKKSISMRAHVLFSNYQNRVLQSLVDILARRSLFTEIFLHEINQ